MSSAPQECIIPTNSSVGEICQYVASNCKDLKYRYLRYYYCGSVNYPILSDIILWVVIIFSIGFLFLTLGLLASDFLVPNLSALSDTLNLDEKLSGLTLLAFANGAPDILSTYIAIKHGMTSMALGELLGSTNFALTVVIGVLAIYQPFKVNQNTFLRDLIVFSVLILASFCILKDGTITIFESIILCLLYISFILLNLFLPQHEEKEKQEPNSLTQEHVNNLPLASYSPLGVNLPPPSHSHGSDHQSVTSFNSLDTNGSLNDYYFAHNIDNLEQGRGFKISLVDSLKLAWLWNRKGSIRPSGSENVDIERLRTVNELTPLNSPKSQQTVEFSNALNGSNLSNLNLNADNVNEDQRPKYFVHSLQQNSSVLLSPPNISPMGTSSGNVSLASNVSSAGVLHRTLSSNPASPCTMLPTENATLPTQNKTSTAENDVSSAGNKTSSIENENSLPENRSSLSVNTNLSNENLAPNVLPKHLKSATNFSISNNGNVPAKINTGININDSSFSFLNSPALSRSSSSKRFKKKGDYQILYPNRPKMGRAGSLPWSFNAEAATSASNSQVSTPVVVEPFRGNFEIIEEHEENEAENAESTSNANATDGVVVRRHSSQINLNPPEYSPTDIQNSAALIPYVEYQKTTNIFLKLCPVHIFTGSISLHETLLSIIIIPLNTIFNLIIPVPLPEELTGEIYRHEWSISTKLFHFQALLFPLIMFDLQTTIPIIITSISLAAISIGLKFGVPHFYDTVFPVISSLVGFLVVLKLITLLASAIIFILKSIGDLYSLSESILGLTILSLGNSIGDVVTNLSLAGLGRPLTGLHACFGSPLLYFLFGIGVCSLIVQVSSAPQSIIEFQVDKSLRLTAASIIFMLFFYTIALSLTNWTFKRWIGYVGVALWLTVTVVNFALHRNA